VGDGTTGAPRLKAGALHDREVSNSLGAADVPVWRVSSKCSVNGSCVLVAHLGDGRVAVRDSKAHEASPILVFDSDAWGSFVDAIKAGEFN
jgi:hypothetical protein